MSEFIQQPAADVVGKQPLNEVVGLVPPALPGQTPPPSVVEQIVQAQPDVELITEMQLENFSVHRGEPNTQNAEGVHHRAEISPRHHQAHIDRASGIVPDIGTRSAEEQDLIGSVLEIGDEAVGQNAPQTVDSRTQDPTQAYVEATAEHGIREKIDRNSGSIKDFDAIFPAEKPPHVQAMIAKVEADSDRLKASIPEAHAEAAAKYRDEQAAASSAEAAERSIEARVNALPWDNERVQKWTTERARNILEDHYNDLIMREQREPMPDDQIKIPYGLRSDSDEYQTLLASGVSEETLQSRYVTRKELVDAGYFFVNSLGGGEKPLIQGAFTDPENPDVQLDFSKRKLLTRSELEAVYRYQQVQGMGLKNHSTEKVRADMLLFMDSAIMPQAFESSTDAAEVIFPDHIDDANWQVGSDEERAAAISYVAGKERQGFLNDLAIQPESNQAKLDRNRIYNERPFTAAGFRLVFRKGIVGATMPIRMRSLVEDGSPFLDSGFRFGMNPDVFVEMPDDDQGRRLNMVNVHLAGGHPDFPGLSEQGSTDWDQKYMSVGEFVDNIYASEVSSDEVRELSKAGLSNLLTEPEQLVVEDLQYLDPAAIRNRLMTSGQTRLIELAKKTQV